MEKILLAFIRASREGDWFLHLSALRSLIPWTLDDKVNYAHFLPVYYAQMTQLPSEKTDIHAALMNGLHSVHRSTGTFAEIPVDQAIEVTVNRDTQTTRGTTRFSLKPGAVKRYIHYCRAKK